MWAFSCLSMSSTRAFPTSCRRASCACAYALERARNPTSLRSSPAGAKRAYRRIAGWSRGNAIHRRDEFDPNPLQVGLLHWYDANLTTTFARTTSSYGVAFDGANVWVSGSNKVTKLRASDGATLDTFAVGNGSAGVAFDGANVWVGNPGGDNVIKLRASDGAILGTFTAGSYPFGVAFDGTNIWVTNFFSAQRDQAAGQRWRNPRHLCRGR